MADIGLAQRWTIQARLHCLKFLAHSCLRDAYMSAIMCVVRVAAFHDNIFPLAFHPNTPDALQMRHVPFPMQIG